MRLAAGEDLSASVAAANKVDGPAGFFLVLRYEDAEFFALRRGVGAVIEYALSAGAMKELQLSGVAPRPIPRGLKSPRFQGDELYVPPDAFALFDRLRRSGEITVRPVP